MGRRLFQNQAFNPVRSIEFKGLTGMLDKVLTGPLDEASWLEKWPCRSIILWFCVKPKTFEHWKNENISDLR